MLISVTIPVFNNNDGLKISLNSLLKQTYSNWEAVIVDDGSAIPVEEVVKSYKDDRMRLHTFSVNCGRPVARQQTFKMISGQYGAFLDAGDSFDPNYLKNAVEIFSKNHQLLGVSQSMLIKYKKLVFSTNYNNVEIDVKDPEFEKVGFASTIFKSEICKGYTFNPHLKHSEDRPFLNYISANYTGNIFTLNSHGYIYNQGNDNIKVATTFTKYYYDSMRSFLSGKTSEGIKSFAKAIFMPVLHVFFGYEKLLTMRYKKEKVCAE